MRSLFLILVLANLLLLACQFTVVRDFVTSVHQTPRASQLNAEKLRIVRDTSGRSPAAPTAPN